MLPLVVSPVEWQSVIGLAIYTLSQYSNILTTKCSKIRFASKTTFKPILCPDHAVGVLRYICCEDGQTKNRRRDADGLTCKPHTHYSRSVYETNWRLLIHSNGNNRKSLEKSK